MYARLRDHDRSTYAFFDPHFGSDERPHSSLSQMVEYYVLPLSRTNIFPLILGGWSFGGIVAFKAAQQLIALGFDVKGLILIDSPDPIDHEPLPDEVIAHLTKSTVQSHAFNSNASLRDEFQFSASLLRSYKPVPFPSTQTPRLKTVMLRSRDTLDVEGLCGVRYDWLSDQNVRDAAIVAREGLVGGPVKVLPVPGHHFEVFSHDNIGETEAQLWNWCRYVEELGE